MKLEKIKVNNFRLLKSFELDLENELSLIIGKNNCGKTSLLTLLDIFLGTKSNIKFSFNDFNLNFQKKFKEYVLHSKEIDDNTYGIALTLFIRYEDDDSLININKLMLDLDPDNHYVVLNFEYIFKKEDLSQLISDKDLYIKKEKSKEEYNKSNNKKTDSSLYDEFIEDNYEKYFHIYRKSIAFDYQNNTEDLSQFIDIDKEQINLSNIINFKKISANRSVSNVRSDKTLSILASKYYENQIKRETDSDCIEKFKDTLKDTDKNLDEVYNGIFKGLITKVKKFGGIQDGDSEIKVTSNLQHRNLLEGNTTVKYDQEESYLPENFNGLGYMNLISMIFEIEVNLFDFRREDLPNENPADINLFFIEEPEAHTHPQMQYVFIKNIKQILKQASDGEDNHQYFNLQTIITTHSSHIVAESEFDDLKYFYKLDKSPEVKAKNLKDLENEFNTKDEEDVKRYKFLKQYLTLNRSELFFADKAIFIEGDTERILLPAIMKKIDQEDRDKGCDITPILSQNVSIVEVGAYSHKFNEFIDFINIKSLIITDIDSAEIVDSKNKQGEIIYNKDKVTPKQKIQKCCVSDATITTNSSLIHFFNGDNIDKLKKMQFKDKIFAKENEGWKPNESGNLLIVYQTEEKDNNNTKYSARSFEDAFFHKNKEYIKKEIKSFRSLKNKSEIKDIGSFEFAERCINKKTEFAIEILLNSEHDKNNKYINWDIPSYIKEGLQWLKK